MNIITDFKKIRYCVDVILENIDRILCLSILFIGIIILSISYKAGIGQYGLGLAFFLGSVIYYILDKKIDFKNVNVDYLNTPNKNMNFTLFLSTNIVFFICLNLSLIILHNIQYIRPPIYFILVTIAFLSIFVEIFNIQKDRALTYFIITKTLLLSLSFRGSRFYSFPVIPGSDIHYHLTFAKSIALTGKITEHEAGKYMYSPLWHIFEAINNLVLSINFADILFISIVTMFTIIISLFMFVIVKNIFNVEVALIALLFVNVADMLFVRGVTSITTSSFVHCFFIVTLFSLIQNKNKTVYSFFITLFIFCSILTHQLSTFSFFIIIISLFIGKYFYSSWLNDVSSKNNKNIPINITENTALYFFVSMIFYWSVMGSSSDNSSFFDSMISRLYQTLISMYNEYTSVGTSTTVYADTFSQYGMVSNIMYNLGYSILFGLAVVGLLLLLNRNYRSTATFSLIFASMMLFMIIYPGTFFGLDKLLIPHRFISFLELFLIIFASFLTYIIYKFQTTNWRKLGSMCIIGLLIFFMITTPFINRNDPVYCADREYRTEYKLSELKALEWGTDYSNNHGNLYVDPLIEVRPLSTIQIVNISVARIMEYPPKFDVEYMPRNVLIRSYIIDNPELRLTGSFGDSKSIVLDLFIENVSEKYNLVYSINSARIYKNPQSDKIEMG